MFCKKNNSCLAVCECGNHTYKRVDTRPYTKKKSGRRGPTWRQFLQRCIQGALLIYKLLSYVEISFSTWYCCRITVGIKINWNWKLNASLLSFCRHIGASHTYLASFCINFCLTHLGPRLQRKTQTRLKTNLKLSVLNNTKLCHFWAQIASWAPRHVRKTFIVLAPWSVGHILRCFIIFVGHFHSSVGHIFRYFVLFVGRTHIAACGHIWLCHACRTYLAGTGPTAKWPGNIRTTVVVNMRFKVKMIIQRTCSFTITLVELCQCAWFQKLSLLYSYEYGSGPVVKRCRWRQTVAHYHKLPYICLMNSPVCYCLCGTRSGRGTLVLSLLV